MEFSLPPRVFSKTIKNLPRYEALGDTGDLFTFLQRNQMFSVVKGSSAWDLKTFAYPSVFGNVCMEY